MLNMEAYFKRIDYTGDAKPTIANLKMLQKAHLTHVPYENLDLIYHRAGSLEPETVYQKVVEDHRGGYCFELNGLFAELLRQMGYEVTEYFGRWLLGEKPFPARRHRILDVTAEGKRFISDVGVGCVCPLEPLEFVLNETQMREGRAYRIIREEKLGNIVQTDTGEGFVNFYSFTEDPQWTIDFLYVHHYCATHPDSVFAKMAKIHIFTETGRNSIMDEVNKETGKVERVARLSRPGGMEKFIIRDEQELYQILKQDFNIEAVFLRDSQSGQYSK